MGWRCKSCNHANNLYRIRCYRCDDPRHEVLKSANRSLEERLLEKRKIDPITGCWLWIGAKNSGKYGKITIDQKEYIVSRVAASVWLGLDLNDLNQHACHRPEECNNILCFNPRDLYIGNHTTNMTDIRILNMLNWDVVSI